MIILVSIIRKFIPRLSDHVGRLKFYIITRKKKKKIKIKTRGKIEITYIYAFMRNKNKYWKKNINQIRITFKAFEFQERDQKKIKNSHTYLSFT